jgi:hypothetical protein
MDLTRPPVDLHQFRQTQTLSTIYNYFINGIDIFKPEIDTNGSHSIIILEFPIYQAIVAFFMKIFGYHEEIARVINITVTVFGAIYLAKICEEFFLKGSFLFVLIPYLFNPSIIFWSSTILIDPFVLGLSIIATYFLFRWSEYGNNNDYYIALFLGSVSLITKLTVPFILFLSFALYIIFHHKFKKLLIKLLIMGLVWVIFIGCWMAYSKYWNGINPHVYTNGSVSWYLGTLDQRLDFNIYSQFFLRFLNNHLGYVSLVPILVGLIISFFRERVWIIFLVMIFSILAYLVIFVNLNYIHTYYQLPINAGLAILSGLGLCLIFSRLEFFNIIIFMVLFITFMGSRYVLNNYWIDVSPISTPYHKSECERDIGLQVANIFHRYNVKPNYVGVRLEHSNDCWNGEHTLMYYMKGRGYVTLDRSDPRLENTDLDLLIDIHKDYNMAKFSNMYHIYSHRLEGSVNQYSVDMFSKFNPEFNYTLDEYEGMKIKGESSVVFNEKLKIIDLKIPPFSQVDVSVNVKSVGDANGFVIMRTYTGGYQEDNYREFELEGGVVNQLHFRMTTSRYLDYIFIFGTKLDSEYSIISPISIHGESIFKAYR